MRSAKPDFDHGRLARRAPRHWRSAVWLQALLLALAPLLVAGFYSVVNDAVERGPARRAPPPARARANRLPPVVWDCRALPGAALHGACRPMPTSDASEPVRVSIQGG